MPYKNPDDQRRYQRERLAKTRRDFFAGKVCVKCGSSSDLELDHIDRTEKVSHSIWSWRRERREAELAKCQVLCHDCHWVKTVSDLGYGKHGTSTKYREGCRCRECLDERARLKRQTRARAKDKRSKQAK